MPRQMFTLQMADGDKTVGITANSCEERTGGRFFWVPLILERFH